MALTLREKIDSRESQEGDNPSVTFLYDLEGTSDDLAAKALVRSSTPASYDGLCRQSINLTPQSVDTVSGTGLWSVSVKYGLYPPPKETGQATFSFDTSGGTQHITQSISTTQKKGLPGKVAPDFKGAVGVTHDAVEGVDITIPVFSFGITCYIAAGNMSEGYINGLYQLTGKVNSAAWTVNVDGVVMTFAAGECLFLGASGSKRGSDDWEIGFKFAASPNATGLEVGPIKDIDKKGWEYMWVRYADTPDTDAKTVVKAPLAVYVEKVYEEGDFTKLGIT